jgi:hypothetical protein
MLADDIETYVLAQDLIKAGLRLSIVTNLTGLPQKKLRSIYRHVFNSSPPNGRLADNCLFFATSLRRVAQISSFCSLHIALHGTPSESGEDLLTSWREYQRLCGELDINAAYYAVRDVRVKIVQFPRCDRCKVRHIYDRAKQHTESCPFCRHPAPYSLSVHLHQERRRA